jgi:hypothetical protein
MALAPLLFERVFREGAVLMEAKEETSREGDVVWIEER